MAPPNPGKEEVVTPKTGADSTAPATPENSGPPARLDCHTGDPKEKDPIPPLLDPRCLFGLSRPHTAERDADFKMKIQQKYRLPDSTDDSLLKALAMALAHGEITDAYDLAGLVSDVNTQFPDRGNKTPLHIATINGDLHNVQNLIQNWDADTSLKDEQGKSAEDYAKELSHDMVLRVLQGETSSPGP